MPDLRRCACGKDYWFPGERWQHTNCVANIANAPVANKYARYRDKEKRKAYMRELMRKKRAKKSQSVLITILRVR
jgi:hypothetical protein